MGREANEAGLRRHLAAENRHDMEATLATLDPGCEFVDEQLGRRWHGRDGAREHYAMWWSAFGNTVEGGRVHWVGEDLLIGEASFVGKHVGPFAGIAVTGASLSLPFVVFVTFDDGLLLGERFVYDLNGLLRQLGQPCFEPTAEGGVTGRRSMDGVGLLRPPVDQVWPARNAAEFGDEQVEFGRRGSEVSGRVGLAFEPHPSGADEQSAGADGTDVGGRLA